MGGNGDDHGRIERLLNDPLVQLLMNADRLDGAEVANMLRGAARRLRQRRTAGEDTPENQQYRIGVGIMLINRRGRVFVGRRVDLEEPAWQMPQGGIESGETPLEAARRELEEETGIAQAELLAEFDGWLRYDYPPALAERLGCRGQEQKWFAMLFLGEDSDIELSGPSPEFDDWRWADPKELPDLIVEFKRPLYLELGDALIVKGLGRPPAA